MTNWQPMDTAPRDGTWIVVYSKPHRKEMPQAYRWDHVMQRWFNADRSGCIDDTELKDCLWCSLDDEPDYSSFPIVAREASAAEAHFRLVLQLIASGSTDEMAVNAAKMALRKYP